MNLLAQSHEKKHTVLIFRQNLFRASETFIPLQAENLERYVPLYMGRVQWGQTPAGQKAISIWPFKSKRFYLKDIKAFVESLFSLSPKPWINLTTKAEQKQIKLIHAHFGPDAVRALSISRHLNIPLITNFHGSDVTLKNWRFLASPVSLPYPFLKKN